MANSPSGQVEDLLGALPVLLQGLALPGEDRYARRVPPACPSGPTTTAAAAWSWVEKMLQLAQRTSAPSATRVSISTAVWTVMCREPAIRAPASGLVSPNCSRMAIRPGISCSARRDLLAPELSQPEICHAVVHARKPRRSARTLPHHLLDETPFGLPGPVAAVGFPGIPGNCALYAGSFPGKAYISRVQCCPRGDPPAGSPTRPAAPPARQPHPPAAPPCRQPARRQPRLRPRDLSVSQVYLGIVRSTREVSRVRRTFPAYSAAVQGPARWDTVRTVGGAGGGVRCAQLRGAGGAGGAGPRVTEPGTPVRRRNRRHLGRRSRRSRTG